MSEVRILPSSLRGTLTVPVSKSAAHRAILCAALAGQKDVLPEEKPSATTLPRRRKPPRSCFDGKSAPVTLDCRESGSTLRFLIPLAAALGRKATFIGHGQAAGTADRRLPRLPSSARRTLRNSRRPAADRFGKAETRRIPSSGQRQFAVCDGPASRPAAARRRQRNRADLAARIRRLRGHDRCRPCAHSA